MPASSRLRPIAGAGLRARIMITFGAGALFVSLLLVTTTAILIRRNLLDQRETNVEERAEVNAGLVADKIGKPDVDAQTLFGSLATAGKPSVLVRNPFGGDDYVPFSVDTRYGATALPRSLVQKVLRSKRPAVMRFSRRGEVLLAVGGPTAGQ